MTQAYRIVEWQERYEVDSKSGREAKPDMPIEQLKKGPLRFVRSKVFGHNLGRGFRKLIKEAYQYGPGMDMFTFGLFQKLLEIAANFDRQYRGWILDHDLKPMDAAAIKDWLDLTDFDWIERALEILVKIGWLEITEYSCPQQNPQVSAGLRRFPQASADCLNNRNRNRNKNLTKQKGDSVKTLFDSDSVKAKRQHTSLKLAKIFHLTPNKKADITTIRDILDQLEEQVRIGQKNPKIFDAVIDEAKGCFGHKKLGEFINIMKSERFGYVPVRRGWLSKVRR